MVLKKLLSTAFIGWGISTLGLISRVEAAVVVEIPGGGPQAAAEGVPFAAAVMAEDSMGAPVTLKATGRIASGRVAMPLPAGAMFTDNGDGTGMLEWTPNFTQGNTGISYSIWVTATSKNGSASTTFVIAVHDTAQAPILNMRLPEPLLVPGEQTTIRLTAKDPEGQSVSFSLDKTYASGTANLLDLGNGTATLGFTPSTAGYHYLLVTLTDNDPKGPNRRTYPIVFRVGALVESVRSGAWSSPATWGGTLPTSNNRVCIEHSVTLDTSASVVDLCVEGGGVLQASRTTSSKLSLRGSLIVMDGGALDYGTPANPIPAGVTAEISFSLPPDIKVIKGNDPVFAGEDPMMSDVKFGDVGLWVMGEGTTATFHGAVVDPTWTWLAKDAPKGAKTLILERPPVGWKVGGQILITPTRKISLKSTSPLNEVELHTIAAIRGNEIDLVGTTGQLFEGILYAYDKVRHTIRQIPNRTALAPDEIFIPIRAAVGYLDRNIKVGSAGIQTDADLATSGRAHTIFMHGAKGLICYTQFKNMGPGGALGRYATHLHKLGENANGFLIRGNAIFNTLTVQLITDTPGKGIVLHSVLGASARENVLFNLQGRAIYMEAGDEAGNTVADNLVVLCRGPERLFNDVDPLPNSAGLWVRTKNTIQRNFVTASKVIPLAVPFPHPGDGSGEGIWLAFAFHPTDPSPTVIEDNITCNNAGNGFRNNTDVVFLHKGLLTIRNGSEGYLAYASTNQSIVKNAVFVGNRIGNYQTALEQVEDCLFLGDIGRSASGQPTIIPIPGPAFSPRNLDTYMIFRRNIFDGFQYTARFGNAYLTFEGNYMRTPISLERGGAQLNGPCPAARLTHNTGPGVAGYPAECSLISRGAPRPEASAIYDPYSRAWRTVSPLLPAGGKIIASVKKPDGTSNNSAQATLLYNGFFRYSYSMINKRAAFQSPRFGRPPIPESDGTGYSRLLSPGTYELILSESGKIPVAQWADLPSGKDVQLPSVVLQAAPVAYRQGGAAADPTELTVQTIRAGLLWILKDGEVLGFASGAPAGQDVPNPPSLMVVLPKGSYELLAREAETQPASAVTKTSDSSVTLAPAADPKWDPSVLEGKIYGTVRNVAGAAVAGATIQLRDVSDILQQVTLTGADGSYTLQGVPTGTYTVRAVKAGATRNRTGVTLLANGRSQLDIAL